ncbi:MAG: hypothetical protein AB1744_07525, partial [Candidatus Zixiibacteriota bacterium]
MRTTVILTTLAVAILPAATATAKEYTTKSFREQLELLEEDADIIQLCKEYFINAEDIDVIREAQNVWNGIDPDGARQYCDALAKSNPRSARHVYLCGRIAEDPLEQIQLGRRAIELDPDWPYGYRLVLATYVTKLFDVENDDRAAVLRTELPKDEHLFAKLVELDPEDTYPLEFQFSYLIDKRDYSGALAALERGRQIEGNWPTGLEFAGVYAYMGQYERVLPTIENEVNRRIEEWGWEPDDPQLYIRLYCVEALRDAGAYQKAVEYRLSVAGDNPDSIALYDVACLYSLMGKKDSAFAYLEKVAGSGWYKAKHIHDDSDLDNLRDDTRWATFASAVETNWEKSKSLRKQEALSEKKNETAPDWSLVRVDE